MIELPEWLASKKVSIGAVVAAGAVIFAGYTWISSSFVYASDFRNFQTGIEVRILKQQENQLESEKLRLEVKREAYPQKFDAVDKALLNKYEQQLRDVKREIRQTEERGRK